MAYIMNEAGGYEWDGGSGYGETGGYTPPPVERAPANSWEKWLQSQGMPLDTQPTEQLQQQYQGGQGGSTLLGGGSQPRTLTQQDFQFYNQQHAPAGYVDWGADALAQYNQYMAGQGGFGGLPAGATDEQYRHAIGLDTATQGQKDAFARAAATQGSDLAKHQDIESQKGQTGITGSAIGDMILKAGAGYLLGPLGGALVGGLGGLASGQDPLKAIGGAAAGYFGGQLAGDLLGGAASTAGDSWDFGAGFDPGMFDTAGDAWDFGASALPGDWLPSTDIPDYQAPYTPPTGDAWLPPTDQPDYSASYTPPDNPSWLPATDQPDYQAPPQFEAPPTPGQPVQSPIETPQLPATDQPDYGATYTPPTSPDYLPSTDQPDFTAPAQPDFTQDVVPPGNSNYLPSTDQPDYTAPAQPDWSNPGMTPPDNSNYLPDTDQPDYTAPGEVTSPSDPSYLPSTDQPDYTAPPTEPPPTGTTAPDLPPTDQPDYQAPYQPPGSLSDWKPSDFVRIFGPGLGAIIGAGGIGGGGGGSSTPFVKRGPVAGGGGGGTAGPSPLATTAQTLMPLPTGGAGGSTWKPPSDSGGGAGAGVGVLQDPAQQSWLTATPPGAQQFTPAQLAAGLRGLVAV